MARKSLKKSSPKKRKNNSGKSKRNTKKRNTKKRSIRKMKHNFGNLLSMMGNFSPAEMSLAQSTTGLSAPQMRMHLEGILPSDIPNYNV